MKLSENVTPLSVLAAASVATVGERLLEAALVIIPVLFELAAIGLFIFAAGVWSAWEAGIL